MEESRGFAFSTLLDSSFEDGVDRITHALKSEGFGVITKIDIKAVMKEKLDKDFRKYVILGACSPGYAEKTLEIDLDVGLLLPCNVIVYETDDKKTNISAVNPVSALEVISDERLRKIADEVSGKLKNAVEKVGKG